MKSYIIEGKVFELDETKKYLDFSIVGGKPMFFEVTFDLLFGAMQAGQVKAAGVEEDFILLDRWIRDAPRKRFYRQMRLDGMAVLTSEYFFESFPDDKAEEVFVGLENTGLVARRFFETFLPEVAAKCKLHHHPADPRLIDA